MISRVVILGIVPDAQWPESEFRLHSLKIWDSLGREVSDEWSRISDLGPQTVSDVLKTTHFVH
jgi:hypothetical protein